MFCPVRGRFLREVSVERELPKQVPSGRRRLYLFECIGPIFELVLANLALFQMLLGLTRLCGEIGSTRWSHRVRPCGISNIKAGVLNGLNNDKIRKGCCKADEYT